MKFGLKRLNTWLVPPIAIAGLQAFIYSLDFSGQLPDPMAIHWGITMQPDGFVSVRDFALTVLIAQLALWLPSIAADIWPKSKIRIRNLVILVFGIVFWLVTVILCVSLFIQVGATDAAAVYFPWPVFVGPFSSLEAATVKKRDKYLTCHSILESLFNLSFLIAFSSLIFP